MAARTSQDFFNDFDELMRNNNRLVDLITQSYADVPEESSRQHVLRQITTTNGETLNPEIIIEIVKGIKEGNRVQLNRLNDLNEYLRIASYIIFTNQTLGNYPNIWEDADGVEVDADGIAEIERNMGIIIDRLLDDLNVNRNKIAEFFGIVTPSTRMALESLGRQGLGVREPAQAGVPVEELQPITKRVFLPEHVIKREIQPYLGKDVTGGKKKTRRRIKKNNKRNKTKTKPKTKSRRIRRSKRRY
jgi:hypothetical protein